MTTLPPRHRREITNRFEESRAISSTAFPSRPGFVTRKPTITVCLFLSTSPRLKKTREAISFRTAIKASITPTTPSGYVTAHPSAKSACSSEGSLICFSVCWAAPSAGVLVTAPESTPTMSGSDTPVVQWNTSVIALPSRTTSMASMLSFNPLLPKEEKKPGPTCNPRA